MTNRNIRIGWRGLGSVAVATLFLTAVAVPPATANHVMGHHGNDNDHFNQDYIGFNTQPEFVAQADGSGSDRSGPRIGGCPIGIGTLAGAALGGLVGAHIGAAVATGVGVVIGGVAGNTVDCP